MYAGWNVNVDRLFFANGRRTCSFPFSAFCYVPSSDMICRSCFFYFFKNTVYTGDPWREATVSADGLGKASTATQPIYESDGFHCSDFFAKNGDVDESIRVVQMAALEYMKEWLA